LYEEDYAECAGTKVAAKKGVAPPFHGCYTLPDDQIGILMDLAGISLPQYLAAIADEKDHEVKQKRALDSFKQLFQKLIDLHLDNRDPNNENYLVRECSQGISAEKGHLEHIEPISGSETRVVGIDWTGQPSTAKINRPVAPLLAKLRQAKQIQDAIYSLKQDAKHIQQEPPRLKQAKKRLLWLRDWEQCTKEHVKENSPKASNKRKRLDSNFSSDK
jgi:hypothetical protein